MDYEHDAAGFVTRRGGETIAWTAHGRIAAVGTRAELEWDALGRPTRRRIESDERRFGFGGRVETDAAGVPLRIDLDAVVLELASGERRYRHTDLRGNVQLVSDDTGQVVAHYRYDAYGVATLTGADDGAATFARGRALGDLVVLGPRLHDPLSGRFLAPDPLFQDVSQHTYAGGNPVWWWDRSGAHPEQIDAAEVSRTASELEAEAAAGEDLVMVGKGFTFVAALAATVSTAAGGWIAAIGGGALVAGWSQKNTANRKKQAFVNFVATTQSQHSPNPSKGSGTQPQPCAASCGTGPAGAETGNSLSPGRTAFPSGYWRGFGW
jgi:RHS repeat-associated protein